MIRVAVVVTALFTIQSQAMETESADADTLASVISACTLNQEQDIPEQQTPVDDPIYFTIKNETCKDMPVNLQISYFYPYDYDSDICYDTTKFDTLKIVKTHSETTFRQSDCLFFKEILDSYKTKKTKNPSALLSVWMHFNVRDEDFSIFSGAESQGMNPNNIPYSRTYIIKPEDEDSFNIEVED